MENYIYSCCNYSFAQTASLEIVIAQGTHLIYSENYLSIKSHCIVTVITALYACYYYHLLAGATKIHEAKNNYKFQSEMNLLSLSAINHAKCSITGLAGRNILQRGTDTNYVCTFSKGGCRWATSIEPRSLQGGIARLIFRLKRATGTRGQQFRRKSADAKFVKRVIIGYARGASTHVPIW